jgi:hypothetical protein
MGDVWPASLAAACLNMLFGLLKLQYHFRQQDVAVSS